MAFIKINGINLPAPARGLKVIRTQLVDSGRNANGQVISQKVNRRQIKFDNLYWPHLKASQWQTILNEIEKFEGDLTFWNALSGAFETIRVYWGDATEEPFKVNKATGEVTEYINCQCNIIDCGY